MTFTLLPALDVADGKAVRLAQGSADSKSGASSPHEIALRWQAEGAEWIHLVDLDAAFGRGSNAELLASVVGDLRVNVELSGGIDDEASLTYALATGCARAVLSTAALRDPEWCGRAIAAHGDRVAVALDVRIAEDGDGLVHYRLAPRGGTGDVGDLWETLEFLDQNGCARYIVTDVSKDGMLSGPNLELYGAIARATKTSVIASGGVASIGDLVTLAETAAAGSNIEGAVVGKALHTGQFTLSEALKALRRVA